MKVKTKIRYNGQEYSDPSELPPNVRVAYEQAMAGKAAVKKKIVVNGEEFSDETGMPDEVGRLYADIMSVVQNNGHVTLPGKAYSHAFPTKGQIRAVSSFLGALGLIALLLFIKRVS